MIVVVLPAYNEEPEMPVLLERFSRLAATLSEPLRVVVVDDGSRDGTAAAARGAAVSIPVEVIVHGENRGLGGALRTGLTRAAQLAVGEDDAIVTMDSDNTHDPVYVRAMRERMEREGLDVVVASRYASGGEEIGVNAWRRFLSRGASVLYGVFFRTRGLSDYTCGYRMFRASVIREAVAHYGERIVEEASFAATGEIILKLRHFTERFGEVPFSLRYDMKHTPSKMNKLRTMARTLRVLWKHRSRPESLRKTDGN